MFSRFEVFLYFVFFNGTTRTKNVKRIKIYKFIRTRSAELNYKMLFEECFKKYKKN